MPHLKPNNGPAYLAIGPQPLESIARTKRNAEVRANCLAVLKLLAVSAILGFLLALRK